MAVEVKESSSCSAEGSQEENKCSAEEEFTNVIIWALQKLIPIEQRLYSTGIFDLVKDSLQAQKIELLWLLKAHPQQVRPIWFLLKEPDQRVSLEDLTDVLVWAFRELRPIEERLYSIGIFDYADDFLADQEMALLQLLRKPPDQVRRELLVIQQHQEKKNQPEPKK